MRGVGGGVGKAPTAFVFWFSSSAKMSSICSGSSASFLAGPWQESESLAEEAAPARGLFREVVSVSVVAESFDRETEAAASSRGDVTNEPDALPVKDDVQRTSASEGAEVTSDFSVVAKTAFGCEGAVGGCVPVEDTRQGTSIEVFETRRVFPPATL